MTAYLWFFALDVADVVCIALLGARVLAALPNRLNAWLVAVICVCGVCHTVLARYDYSYWIPPSLRLPIGPAAGVLDILRNCAPGLHMILVRRLFVDEGRVPRPLLVLFGLELFLERPVRWLGAPLSPLVTEWAPTLIQTLFAVLALYWTLSGWRTDLVEARRRARMVVMAVLTVNFIASSILLRVLIPTDTPANYHWHLILLAANLAVAVLLLVAMGRADIAAYLEPDRPAAVPGPAPVDDRELSRLLTLVEGERLYQEPGLSLRSLADRAGLPEYRLRRLIHEGLGYRNFNAFLHAYRIREACAQLGDPAQRRTPILTIALSVGYQSLNTFNRGFREVMGVTPSTYRAEGRAAGQKPQSDPKS